MFDAAKMAASELNDTMDSIKNSEFGSYPGPAKSSRTLSRQALVDNAPERIRELKDHGYPMYMIEELARRAMGE